MARISDAISMVRAQLRGVDDDTYAPHYVPIGPYHRNRSSPGIEKEKVRSAGWLQCLSEEHAKAGLTGLMEELEPLARQCYDADGISDMRPEQLSSLLLNDGCYLLLLFVDYVSITSNRSSPAPGDDGRLPPAPVISGNTLVRDTIFLLENQIPLFVLQRLHERVTGGTSSILDCMAEPVQEILHKLLFISKKPRPAPPTCSHLLHLVHAYLQPRAPPPPAAEEENTAVAWRRSRRRRLTGRWRLATEYQRYANVRFKPRDFEDHMESSVLDVQHDRGTLRIPRVRIDSNTWTVLRNLMALEEQAQYRRRSVTAYCLFMSQVACTAVDVELLRRAGIVDHFLNNDEQAAQGFADLCRGVVMDVDDLERNYLKPLWHELEERYESRVEQLMGWFRQGQNVLIAATFVVVVILVACQVIQTFYAAAGRGQQP
ncbi:UPF0481 protein At3g47200-like [Miscanthus floridulus]|uniref:UPF0481 protein At3g47200-like n=1 Tax=Miscanthus floridulus TaxID=154761 RepID=UPI00345773A2